MSKEIRDKIYYYECKLLECVGVQRTTFSRGDDELHALHYLTFGTRSNPPLLLIHGYGGSGIAFFKVIPQLSKHFYLIIIDLLGFGCSDRPSFKFDTFQNTMQFFTIPIVSLLNYLKVDKILIVGHSMGGLIAGHLAEIIKDRVTAVFFAAAAGFTNKDFTQEEAEIMFRKFAKWFDMPTDLMRLFTYLTLEKKYPLFNMLSNSFKFDYIETYFDNPMLKLTREERDIFVKYYKQVHLLGSGGHNAIWSLVKFGGYCDHPIIKILSDNPDIIAFVYYGENEWLDWQHAFQELKRIGQHKNFRVLKDTTHQIFFNNPSEFLNQFYQDYNLVFRDGLFR